MKKRRDKLFIEDIILAIEKIWEYIGDIYRIKKRWLSWE